MAAKKRPILYWRREDTHSYSTGLTGRGGGSNAGEKRETREGTAGISKMDKRPLPKNESTDSSRTKQPTSTDPVQDREREATLKELCPVDKIRVRQLVEQLAIVGDEKERLEKQVLEDRNHFSGLLVKLKEHHRKVVEEKQRIVAELQSSQLQLQDLHKYPTLSTQIPPNSLVQKQPPFHQPISSHSSSSTSTTPLVVSHGCLITDHVTPVYVSSTSQTGHVTPVSIASTSQTGHVTPASTTSTSQTSLVTPVSTVVTSQTNMIPLSSAQRPSILISLPCNGSTEANEMVNNSLITPTEDWQSLLLATPSSVTTPTGDGNYSTTSLAQRKLFSRNLPASPCLPQNATEFPPITGSLLQARDLVPCTALQTHDACTQTAHLESISTQTEPDIRHFMVAPRGTSVTSSAQSLSALDSHSPSDSTSSKAFSSHSGRPFEQVPSSKINGQYKKEKVKGQNEGVRVQRNSSRSELLPSKINPSLSRPLAHQYVAKPDGKLSVEESAHTDSSSEGVSEGAGIQSGSKCSLGKSCPQSKHIHGISTSPSEYNIAQRVSEDVRVSRQSSVCHSSVSIAQNGSYPPDQPKIDILLASALLNAEHTLHAIKTLTTSVGSDQSVLDTHEVPSVGVVYVDSDQSVVDTHKVPGVGSDPVPGVVSPSPITHSINRTNSDMPRSTSGGPASTETYHHPHNGPMLRNSKPLESPLSTTDLISVLNPTRAGTLGSRPSDSLRRGYLLNTEERSKANFHSPSSKQYHSGSEERKYRTTSTPRFQDQDGDMLLETFGCQLGSTIGDQSSFHHIAEIFEHAHSQSQRLHEVDKSYGNHRSEHAQLLARSIQPIYDSETEDESSLDELDGFTSGSRNSSHTLDSRDGYNDLDIIEQLFFIQ